MNKIEISENGIVTVESNVLMRQYEIANLFEVFTVKISSNIKSILKSGIITPDYTHGGIVAGNRVIPNLFGLDMITALAFRLNTPKAKIFQQWIIAKALQKSTLQIPIVIKNSNNLRHS